MAQREHKFRAWDEETQEMLYSDKDYEKCTFVCESEGYLKCYVPEEVPATQDEPSYTVGRELLDIMEYTGLKDKNGKEICEGDIVRGTQIIRPEQIITDTIEYNTIFSCWMLGKGRCLQFYHFLEIVGNIHENADLLEK